MDTNFTTSFGRQVRVVANKSGAYIQIKNQDGVELGSAALSSVELQKLFDMVNKATGVVE